MICEKIMKKNPNVSVIIPTYNRAHFVGRAIQSVLDQTYRDFELIIVDDGSTDNTEEVIRKYQEQDKRVKYIRHKKNKNGSAARNSGIKAAKAGYIAFQDSDDEWLSKKLEKQVKYFGKCSKLVGAVYCLYFLQDDSFGYINKTRLSNMKRGNVYKYLLNGWCPSITSSIMLKTQVFEKSGLFDESLPSFQDYDLWIRVAQYYEFEFINKLLVINHRHIGNQIAKDFEPRMKGLDLFCKKWGDVIKNEMGEKIFYNIRRKHISAIYQNAIFNNSTLSNRRDALKYIIQLNKVQSISLTILIKIIIVLFGGTKLLNTFRRIWHKLHINIKNIYKYKL